MAREEFAPPPIVFAQPATQASIKEWFQGVFGALMIGGAALPVIHWVDHAIESPWQKAAATVAVYGTTFLFLAVVIPSSRQPRFFRQYRSYVPFITSVASFVCMGGTIIPWLISSYITPEWQTTAKATAWVGLLSYKFYSLK